MSNVAKLHHLKHLLDTFFEPNDVIDKLPGIGLFTDGFVRISHIVGVDEAARKLRVQIFLEWLQQEEDGNKYQEFVDILRHDENYEWLTPLLEDSEEDNTFEVVKCFRYIKKPKQVGLILNKLFPALANIRVEDIVDQLPISLTVPDREEIKTIRTNRSNRFGLIALLNKLIYKRYDWIEEFVKAVESQNFAPAAEMFENNQSLADVLKDYLGLFDLPENDDGQEYMEITEYEEPVNSSAALVYPHPGEVKDVHTPNLVLDRCKVDEQSVGLRSVHPQIDDPGFTLRKYQEELCKTAILGENVVICAQTGSGKTVVAAYILKNHLNPNFSDHSLNRKVLFFTPTGGLAEQQYDKMKKYLPHMKIEVLRGNFGTEHVEKGFGKKIYSSDLIVMTPQILLNCLQDKTVVSVFDFSLMIFDECHHVNGREPYSEILKRYFEEKKTVGSQKSVQIIGLTATLGIGAATKDDEALKHIFKVLGIMDATGGISIVKKHIQELHSHCHTPEEEKRIIDIGKDDEFKKMITKTTKQLAYVLEKTGVFNKFGNIQEPNGKMDELGKDFETWCCRLRHISGDYHEEDSTTVGRDAGSGASAMQCMKKGFDLCLNCQPSDAMGLIDDFVTSYFKEQQEKNTDSEREFQELMEGALSEFRKYVGHTKNEVLKIIEEKITEKSQANYSFRCMVMVSRRHFAKCLERWMKESPTLHHFKPRIYIGVGNKSNACAGMSHPQQKQAIESFRSGSCRILICTPDAAGEGIDIPECNLVVTVDCIKNEITKVQLQGRVRAKDGEVLNIYFANGMQNDELNTEKLLRMQKATREIDKLFRRDNDRYKELLQDGQRTVINDLNSAKTKGILKLSSRSVGCDEMLCRKCSRFICYTSSLVRINGNHHTVGNIDFKTMYFKSDHPSKGGSCGNMTHLYRIRCNECKHEWGNEVRWNERLIPILKIKGFKIKVKRKKIFQPSTWKKTGLEICEMNADHSSYNLLFSEYVAED